MDLAHMLADRRAQVLQRWTNAVRGDLHPAATPRLELVDHLPSFLDEVARALRARESPETSETAIEHGVQRFNLGFSLDSVVREYGALQRAVMAEAEELQQDVKPKELDLLFGCIVTGIAEAVSEYQRQRDAEMTRQTNEHFAFIAHELRNPLGSALTALAILRATSKITDPRLGDVLERSLKKMNDLIEASLKVARIGSSITVQPIKVMLRTLLADVQVSASAEADAKKIDLEIEVDTDHELVVDVRLVHSALTNLVRNAVKFTHHGGRVCIRAKQSGPRTVIEVEDRCGGLPAGMAEKAFAPFVQMGEDRTGFGLGLAIAKQAAEAHGGTIRIQDLPGTGCIFVLELPTAA